MVAAGVQPRVYAAVSANQSVLHIRTECSFPRLLVSYAFDKKAQFREKIRACEIEPEGIDWLLDSGAFSVWTSGGVVDLDAYIEWAQGWHDEMPTVRAINLDVIPGTPGGKPPTKRDRTAAIKASEKNAQRIRDAGLPVIEVYHWHEPIEVLDAMLDRRQPGMAIGIGGVAGHGSIVEKVAFVDGVFAHIKERAGGWDGIAPLHGLGIAPDAPLGRRYPWASTDASSWLYPQRLGRRIASGGKTIGNDRRNKNDDVTAIYMRRVLAKWTRFEQDLTGLWAARGVRILV